MLSLNDILQVPHLQTFDMPNQRVEFTGVSIDSRTVSHGNVFIPLRGERFDGHNFLSNAVKAGATALLVEKRWAEMNGSFLSALPVPKVIVTDCTQVLGQLANNYRRRFRLPIVAIGGSNGKTTTKEMVKTLLESKFRVLATEGNLNNHIGVPLTLFRLNKDHDVAVVEVGTNHPGEIRNLCTILEPTHGLITNIGHEHLEFFGNLGGVAKAELELFDWLTAVRSPAGTLFLNKNDTHLVKRTNVSKNVFSYGFGVDGVNIRGSALKINEDAMASFSVRIKGKVFEIVLAVPGVHFARNALAATAVAAAFNVPAAKIQKTLGSFSASSKRMEVLRIDGITILNDTYNSNPDSVRVALETIQAMKTTGKKIAVLADMLELGKTSEQQHRAIAKSVAKAEIECLLTYGPLSQLTSDAADVSFKAHYDQKNVLAEYLAELLAPGDIVLVKGSRGMKMEDIVIFLKERFSKAA